MNYLNVKKFGFAVGATGALLYLGCVVLMLMIGHDGTALFINSLLHGLDVSSILRMNMSSAEALNGIVVTFILGWLTGACIAAIYNAALKVPENKK